MARERDNQRKRLYAWGNKYIKPTVDTLMDEEECIKLIREICDHYEIPQVIFRNHGKADHPYCQYREDGSIHIVIPKRQRYRWVVIHEAAHAVNYRKNRYNAGHGAEYVGIYMDALDKFMGMNSNHLRIKAYTSNIAFKVYKRDDFKS